MITTDCPDATNKASGDERITWQREGEKFVISCIMDVEETGETDTNKERKSVVGVSGPRPPMIDESMMPIGREILQDFLATAAQLGDRREDYRRICP